MSEDDEQAAWAHLEQQERQRREDEGLLRAAVSQADLRRMIDETEQRLRLRRQLCQK